MVSFCSGRWKNPVVQVHVSKVFVSHGCVWCVWELCGVGMMRIRQGGG